MSAYQDMVFTTAARLLGNDTDAEDVAQTVFLRAYEHFDEIKGSPTVGGWLKRVATNLCLNHLARYRNRWKMMSEFTATDEPDAEPHEWAAQDDREEQLLKAELQQVLETAMQKLPDAQRVPLVLYHLQDMSYDDIARQLGVSLAKVKTDIHRGREALKKRLTMGRSGIEARGDSVSAAMPCLC